jgi:hypothetical protein
MKTLSTLVLMLSAVISGSQASGGQRLSIRVSPTAALAPALLTIRTVVEPSDDNRLLAIDIDSPAYHRSSDIPLDGRNSPRMNVLEIRGVPPGLYEVRAVLVGPGGPIANTMQLVKVAPAPGHSY